MIMRRLAVSAILLLLCGTLAAGEFARTALVIVHRPPDASGEPPEAGRFAALLRPHKFNCRWVDYREFKYKDNPGDYQLFIIAGSSIPIPGEELLEVDSLIRNSSIPVFGVCYGFQQIVCALGGRRVRMAEKYRGFKTVEMRADPRLPFMDGTVLRVYSSHRWRVTDVPDELIVVGASINPDCPEVVIHRGRAVCGTQFHPELRQAENEGRKVFDAFIERYCGN